MHNKKVLDCSVGLDKAYLQICVKVENFMVDILEWSNELGEIIEKECGIEKEDYKISKEFKLPFQLPKTPLNKKSRARKPRNALVSKNSVLNITDNDHEITNLDSTISTRTRAARRAATSKLSQLNVTKDKTTFTLNDVNDRTTIIDKSIKDFSNATFVMPTTTTSTRTKPVLKNKSPETCTLESKSPDTRVGRINNKISRSLSQDSEEGENRKKMLRTQSKSPEVRQTRYKISRALSKNSVLRSSKNQMPLTLKESPVTRSSSSSRKSFQENSPVQSGRSKVSMTQGNKKSTPKLEDELNISVINKTVTIKREEPSKLSFIQITRSQEMEDESEEKTPIVKGGRFTRLSKTSTPVVDGEKTPLVNGLSPDVIDDQILTGTIQEGNITIQCSPVLVMNSAEEELDEQPVPKKKRKLKKEEEESKENNEEPADTGRITRTKSKAAKQMMEENENKQSDLVMFAKKSLNKAKITSLKKTQLTALLEQNSSTPKNGICLNTKGLSTMTSKSKYHLLLSGSKKLKTPLQTLPNSCVKVAKGSADKDRVRQFPNQDGSASKLPKDDLFEREMKLRSKKEKEEEAAMKRLNVIKSKQEELKRKNELKHQLAMKQREKLEQEKYNNIIQSEKEKEERHKLILQERQMKRKEEANKKKKLTEQKIAETLERRRLEAEARLAKLKEMEAEEQRIALEKQREQERLEKRTQERLAEKKAREEYEMQLKQEMELEKLRAEKMETAKKHLASASKMQSASKRQRFGILGEKKEWDYKARNEDDYGLADEESEFESDDEKEYVKNRPPVAWAKKLISGKSPVVNAITLEMICEYMPCYQKSPDIHKMFKMTPTKRIKRTSSAIWNTPSS